MTPTLRHALDRFDRESLPRRRRCAVDLGCGAGSDTIELLRHGWKVLAIDEDAGAIEALRRDCDAGYRRRLRTHVAGFGVQHLPRADLINVSSAVAHGAFLALPSIWDHMVASLRVGGRFAGQVVGERNDVVALLRCFEVELFHELDAGQGAMRDDEHPPHVFHIVARRVTSAHSEAG